MRTEALLLHCIFKMFSVGSEYSTQAYKEVLLAVSDGSDSQHLESIFSKHGLFSPLSVNDGIPLRRDTTKGPTYDFNVSQFISINYSFYLVWFFKKINYKPEFFKKINYKPENSDHVFNIFIC